MPVGSTAPSSREKGPTEHTVAGGGAPPARRRLPGVPEAGRVLVVAAVPTVAFFLVGLRHMTYAWDDFVQFGVALRHGLGRELLGYGLFEHFGPTNRLTHGLLLTLGGLDARWALAVALPLFFVYCAALTDLARLLGAGWARVALCLAVATVTPATVSLAAILDQYFHVMSVVAATTVATAAYIRWARTRRPVHALTGALAVLFACSVQERGVFVVLFLVLARVLVIDGGVRPGRLLGTWIRTWLRDAPFLAVPVVVAAATATVVALRYVADVPRGGWLETAVLVGRSWAEGFVPMLTGASGTGAVPVVVTSAAVLTLLVWSMHRNAGNVRPWLLLVAWFTLLTVFLGLGRLGLGSVEAALADPHQLTYSLPAAAVLIARLDLRRHPAGSGAAPPAGRAVLAQPAAALVLACLVVHSSLPASGRAAQFAPGYLQAAVASVRAANALGTTAVAPTRLPDALVPAGFFPYNSGELFLRELDPRTVVDLDPRAPFFLAATGRLTSATAVLLSRVEAGARGSTMTAAGAVGSLVDGDFCVSAAGDGRISVPLPVPVELPGGAAWVRVVADGADTEGTVAAGGTAGWSVRATAPLTADQGAVTFVVPAPDVSQVDLLDVRAGRLCLEAVEVWALATVDEDGCAWVGAGGEELPGMARGAGSRCTGQQPGAA